MCARDRGARSTKQPQNDHQKGWPQDYEAQALDCEKAGMHSTTHGIVRISCTVFRLVLTEGLGSDKTTRRPWSGGTRQDKSPIVLPRGTVVHASYTRYIARNQYRFRHSCRDPPKSSLAKSRCVSACAKKHPDQNWRSDPG